MCLLSISDFFNIIIRLYWLTPVLITFFVLIAFFSFFQIIKNFQKKTKSEIIIVKRKQITIFKSKPKNKVEKIDKSDPTVIEIDNKSKKRMKVTQDLFHKSKSLGELSANISNKALETSISQATEQSTDEDEVSHTESFKVTAPKRKYSK